MDVAMSFLGNAALNKIMGASTINQNDELLMFDVTDSLEGLRNREANESMQ
jgi:hypothetical protein